MSEELTNMIDYITQSEFQKANDIFNDVLGQRVSDVLDQEKVAMAQSMYSDDEESEEYEMSDEDEDLEVTEDEFENALDELENEEEFEED